MTADEWPSSCDLVAMLKCLHGKASDRKARLFACACCRRAWEYFEAEQSRRAVEAAEQYADGLADAETMQEAHDAASRVLTFGGSAREGPFAATEAVVYRPPDPHEMTANRPFEPTIYFSRTFWWVFASSWLELPRQERRNETARQAALLRCIFGDPFLPVSFDP